MFFLCLVWTCASINYCFVAEDRRDLCSSYDETEIFTSSQELFSFINDPNFAEYEVVVTIKGDTTLFMSNTLANLKIIGSVGQNGNPSDPFLSDSEKRQSKSVVEFSFSSATSLDYDFYYLYIQDCIINFIYSSSSISNQFSNKKENIISPYSLQLKVNQSLIIMNSVLYKKIVDQTLSLHQNKESTDDNKLNITIIAYNVQADSSLLESVNYIFFQQISITQNPQTIYDNVTSPKIIYQQKIFYDKIVPQVKIIFTFENSIYSMNNKENQVIVYMNYGRFPVFSLNVDSTSEILFEFQKNVEFELDDYGSMSVLPISLVFRSSCYVYFIYNQEFTYKIKKIDFYGESHIFIPYTMALSNIYAYNADVYFNIESNIDFQNIVKVSGKLFIISRSTKIKVFINYLILDDGSINVSSKSSNPQDIDFSVGDLISGTTNNVKSYVLCPLTVVRTIKLNKVYLICKYVEFYSKATGIDIPLESNPFYNLEFSFLEVENFVLVDGLLPVCLRYNYIFEFYPSFRNQFTKNNFKFPLKIVQYQESNLKRVFITDQLPIKDIVYTDYMPETSEIISLTDYKADNITNFMSYINIMVYKIYNAPIVTFCFSSNDDSFVCPYGADVIKKNTPSLWADKVYPETKEIEFYFDIESQSIFQKFNFSLLSHVEKITFFAPYSDQPFQLKIIDSNDFFYENITDIVVDNVNISLEDKKETKIFKMVQSVVYANGEIIGSEYPNINNFSVHYSQINRNFDTIYKAKYIQLNSFEDFNTIIYKRNSIMLSSDSDFSSKFEILFSDELLNRNFFSVLKQPIDFKWIIIKESDQAAQFPLFLLIDLSYPIVINGNFKNDIINSLKNQSKLNFYLNNTNRIPVKINITSEKIDSNLTFDILNSDSNINQLSNQNHIKNYDLEGKESLIMDKDIFISSNSQIILHSDTSVIFIQSTVYIKGGSLFSTEINETYIDHIVNINDGFNISEIKNIVIGKQIIVKRSSFLSITSSTFVDTEMIFEVGLERAVSKVVLKNCNNFPKKISIIQEDSENNEIEENSKWWLKQTRPILCVRNDGIEKSGSINVSELSLETIEINRKVIQFIFENKKFIFSSSFDANHNEEQCIFINREESNWEEIRLLMIILIPVSFIVLIIVASILYYICCFKKKSSGKFKFSGKSSNLFIDN